MFGFRKNNAPAPVAPAAPVVEGSSATHFIANTVFKVAGVAIVGALLKSFTGGKCTARKQCHRDKKLRNELSEKQVDKMIMDSFPASDPASTY